MSIPRNLTLARVVRRAKAGLLHPKMAEAAHAAAELERLVDELEGDDMTPEIERALDRSIAALKAMVPPDA